MDQERLKEWGEKIRIALKNGGFDHLGAFTQQHPAIEGVLSRFFEMNKFDLVVEVGTGDGGMSMMLKDKCDRMGSDFVTYEIKKDATSRLNQNPEFAKRNIKLRCEDATSKDSMNSLKKEISEKGKTLVLCDGGRNAWEFSAFSSILKVGDFVMAHDYAPNPNVFAEKFQNKIWNWLEVEDFDINRAVGINGLERRFAEFEEVAWLCCEKVRDSHANVKNKKCPSVAIVMPVFNRSEYVKASLESLAKTKIEDAVIVIVDDFSSDPSVKDIINAFEMQGVMIHRMFKERNVGMWDSYIRAFDWVDKEFPNTETFATLDSDTLHKPDWLERTCELHRRLRVCVVTGFNTRVHGISKEHEDYYEKHSAGGINFIFSKSIYLDLLRGILHHSKNSWDNAFNEACRNRGIKTICTKPSVIQHIGRFGVNSPGHRWDHADDF